MCSQPNPREVEAVFTRKLTDIDPPMRSDYREFGQDDDDCGIRLSDEALDEFEVSGLTWLEWLHPDAARQREREREG